MSTAASTGPAVSAPAGTPPGEPGSAVDVTGALMPGKTGAPDGAGPHDQLGVGWAPVPEPELLSIGAHPVGVMSWPGQT